MFSKPPVITDVGITLLLRAAGGEQITFTKFQAGNGILSGSETPKTMTALKSLIVDDIGITEAVDTGNGYIELSGSFDNQNDIHSDFRWTELGLIAEDENGVEYLYAYGYDDEYAELINASDTAVILEQHINVIIAIGESENITANVLPDATYASKAAFEAHVADKSNPHEVTYAQAGAAAAVHTHDAGAIVSGTLPLARGGTGVTTLAALKELIGSELTFGYFQGNGATRLDITLGFKPDVVWLFTMANLNKRNYFYGTQLVAGDTADYYIPYNETSMFMPGRNIYHYGCPESCADCDADTLFARGHGGAAVTNTGFAVGYYTSGNTQALNRSGWLYGFIAGTITDYTPTT